MKNQSSYGELRVMMSAESYALSSRGIPVPGTGVKRFRDTSRQPGVMANSRIVSGRWADEREKGKKLRREIRRKEKTLWMREWAD